MERFITYMYAYENKTKGRNVGFVKVECRKDTCALEIHIRNLGRFSGKCRTYLLMDENVIGVELGHVIISCGQGQAIYYFDRNDIEQSGYRLEQVKAVRVECGNQEFLASCWSEEAGNWITQFNSGHYNMAGGNMAQLDNVADQNTNGKQNNNVYAGILQTESPQPQIDRIDLADIRRLFPTKQYYANNSFVIHGFMNYNHLIVKTEDNKKYLGVPGIYEKPEEMMAKLFGFTEFVDEKTHSESQSEGAFGYWLSQAL